MKQFNDVDSKRGAPMGRRHFVDNPEATVTLFLVRMVDGDYDDGGAYWGGPPSEPLYCARDAAGEVETFIRAENWAAAKAALHGSYPDMVIEHPDIDIDDVVAAYLECALWSSEDEQGQLDDRASVDDFTERAVAQAREDCSDFLALCEREGIVFPIERGMEATQIGHDFWLTRNGHGAGFWDRGLGQVGRQLSDLCKTYGERHVWLDDDGKAHFE